MALVTFKQTNYLKLNRLRDPSQLQQGEYAFLVNGRVRDGGVKPIKLPTELRGIFSGYNIQGVYGFDKYLIIFANGKAFYRNYDLSDEAFYQIASLQLDTDVDTIYVAAVPASTVNFVRESVDGDASSAVNLTSIINSSPACLVCQDGLNQPWVIFPDGSARITQTYAQWANTATEREYVPIGKQMLYQDGILYIAAKDLETGKYNQLLRSVTGRPLDFVVNVDSTGAAGGDAYTTSYSADFNDITCLSSVGSNDGGFYLSTIKSSYLIIPDFTRPIFNEPQFRNQFLFTTGALNHFALADLLGDAALIDGSGIKSFNAILQTRVEGRNSPFSAEVQPILGTIIQSVVAAFAWDNYGFFAVNTVYGFGILVFDTILQSFVSLDLYGTDAVKQFADIKTATSRQLFFATRDNKVYQFGVGATAQAELYVGEFSPTDAGGSELKVSELDLVFVDVKESGTISAQCFVDSQQQTTLDEVVEQTVVVEPSTLLRPFGVATQDRVRPATFDFNSVQVGWKVGFYIRWNFDAKLLLTTLRATVKETSNNLKEQSAVFKQLTDGTLS